MIKYNEVMAPRRYIELITVWQELENLFSSFCMHAMHACNELDVYLSPSLTQFDDTFRDWLTQLALSIMNDAPETVYKLNLYRKRLDLRTQIYKELCGVIGVPPDPHMLHPTPPKGWMASETYIVVDVAHPSGGVYAINLDKTELRIFDKGYFVLYQSCCFNVWGDDRWSRENEWMLGPQNDRLNWSTPVYRTRDHWIRGLAKVFAPPDCAQIANIFLRDREAV